MEGFLSGIVPKIINIEEIWRAEKQLSFLLSGEIEVFLEKSFSVSHFVK